MKPIHTYVAIALGGLLGVVCGILIYKATDPTSIEKKELHGLMGEAETDLSESATLAELKRDNKIPDTFYKEEMEYTSSSVIDLRDSIEEKDFEETIPISKTLMHSLLQNADENMLSAKDAPLPGAYGTMIQVADHLEALKQSLQ